MTRAFAWKFYVVHVPLLLFWSSQLRARE